MMRPPRLRCLYASRATKNWPRVLRLKTRSNSSFFEPRACQRPLYWMRSLLWSCQGTYLRDLREMPKRDDSGVGDDDVELPILCLRCLKQPRGLLHVPDIGLDRDGICSQGLDLGHNLLGRPA